MEELYAQRSSAMFQLKAKLRRAQNPEQEHVELNDADVGGMEDDEIWFEPDKAGDLKRLKLVSQPRISSVG